MNIPTSPLFPGELDTNDNLFEVHDALRFTLADDYTPGDTSITVEGELLTTANWPANGLVTLTEQCSDLDERAVSFYFSSFDATTMEISGLEILPGFADVFKPKRITNVTINVMAQHHNNIKDALIAIQEFCGVKGAEDKLPFGESLESRINFLRKVVLQPKAWFRSDKRTGNVPLEVEFEDMSFRLGTDGTAGEVVLTWDFGDHTTSTISYVNVISGVSVVTTSVISADLSLISADSIVPDGAVDVMVRDTDGGKIKKIYHQPGKYDVKLTVENDFGQDIVIFEDFITARVKAPEPAIIRFIEDTSTQEADPGVPPNGPFVTPPTIRSPINTLIEIEVEEGENAATPGYSYAGELLNDSDEPIDPVLTWTWALSDDLNHPSNRTTKASYSVGGVYDLKLRVDTEFGAYRITAYEDAIDIVEKQNLWLWVFTDSSQTTVRAYEYGLISETFKLTTATTYAIVRDDSFLDDTPEETKQKSEFNRNVGFAPRSTTGSGLGGSALLYWASGRSATDPVTNEKVNVVEYDGFSGTYITRQSFVRPWNWANLNSTQASYFILGTVSSYPPGTSPTNTVKQTLDLSNFAVASASLASTNYMNGAQELIENPAVYDNAGESIYGNFSVHRTTWKDNTGYILRNDGVGPFFRLKNFYRTEGTSGVPFVNIRKLQDIQGPTKLEGQLVTMSSALYFLNNSGSVSLFVPEDSIWRTGGPGVNSLLYRGLQDSTVTGYDSADNTLLAASDGDKRAYISFDYSENAFLKFNEIDLTFVSLGGRPAGTQFLMGVY
jgi:PKD repeat protein